jgi:hypothetical protein
MKVHLIGSLLCGLLLVTTTSALAKSKAANTQEKEAGGFFYIPGTDPLVTQRVMVAPAKSSAAKRRFYIFDRWGNQITVRNARVDRTGGPKSFRARKVLLER